MLMLELIVVVGLIIWAISRSGSSGSNQQTYRDAQRDELWHQYIASFKVAAKTKGEKRLIDTMIAGDSVDAIITPSAEKFTASTPEAAALVPVAATSAAEVTQYTASVQTSQEIVLEEPKQPMDGTLLLLYFGAFLFVASAGLFVAFGDFNGAIRTFVVIATMIILYGAGFWLHSKNGRLQPAGVTFVAIGMAIAPLVGVAVYHYLATDLDARVIWFGTSVLCASMYVYAFHVLRNTLLSYLFIFSFISLFESAIGVLDVSAPYYVWGLIVVGLLLRFWSLFRRNKELQESSDASAQVLVPLSTFASLFLIPEHGVGQVSVALALAAVYYSLEAFSNKARADGFALAAHVLSILSLATGAYALSDDKIVVAWVLLVLAVLHAALLFVLPRTNVIAQNGASVAFVVVLPVLFLGWPNEVIVTTCLATLTMLGMMIAGRQRRADAFVGGALALIALPIAFGQMILEPSAPLAFQSLISFCAVLVLFEIAFFFQSHSKDTEWRQTTTALYLLSGLVALIPAWLDGGWTTVFSTYAFVATLILMAQKTHEEAWWQGAGFLVCVPILFKLGSMGDVSFAVSVLLALLLNLVFTIICRSETNRWLVTLLMLIAPLAFGKGGLGLNWSVTEYAYAYLGAMLCLILSRSIARGVLFTSSKIPIVSYYHSASYSYVFGYIVAAGIAVAISLVGHNSQLHTSVILGSLICVTLLLSFKVEKNREVLIFIPWLLQGLLLSIARDNGTVIVGNTAVCLSSLIALGGYFLSKHAAGFLDKAAHSIIETCLIMAYLPVLFGLLYDTSQLVLPAMLAVAGLLTLNYTWSKVQATREISGGVIVVAFMWAMHDLGIENIQAYTHVLALVFAGYAIWRYKRADKKGSDSYLQAMFGVATIPLVLQALGGQSGDVYGWWLIVEQVGFMILGVLIHRRFLTWWGLYVAVGAVLYQLRDLGWAALTVLALFVISIAVYRLSRTPQNHK